MSGHLHFLLSKSKYFYKPCNRKQLVGGGGTIFAGFGMFSGSSDNFDTVYDPEATNGAYKNRETLNWKDRLDLMWRKDEFGSPSPELQECISTAQGSVLIGFIIGAYQKSRSVFDRFISENKHEMFRHPREAQLAVADRVFIAMFQGGIKLSWRCGAVATIFSLGIATTNVVRNYIQPLDHAAVGFVAGALYRTMGGPRAMLGAGAIGAGCGFLEGCFSWSLLKISGESLEDKWHRKLLYLENTNSEILESRKKTQEQLIPRSVGDWSANPDDPTEKEQEESEHNLKVATKYILLRAKDFILSRIEK